MGKFQVLATWSGGRDSNSRQPAWKAGTLPTELPPHIQLVGVRGLEPPTSASQTPRATRLRHTPLTPKAHASIGTLGTPRQTSNHFERISTLEIHIGLRIRTAEQPTAPFCALGVGKQPVRATREIGVKLERLFGRRNGMARVIVGMTMSLDGFVSGPDGDVRLLFLRFEALRDSRQIRDAIASTGLADRRSFSSLSRVGSWMRCISMCAHCCWGLGFGSSSGRIGFHRSSNSVKLTSHPGSFTCGIGWLTSARSGFVDDAIDDGAVRFEDDLQVRTQHRLERVDTRR